MSPTHRATPTAAPVPVDQDNGMFRSLRSRNFRHPRS